MAYDGRLLSLWPFLEQSPYFNSGVILLKGNLVDKMPDLPSVTCIVADGEFHLSRSRQF